MNINGYALVVGGGVSILSFPNQHLSTLNTDKKETIFFLSGADFVAPNITQH